MRGIRILFYRILIATLIFASMGCGGLGAPAGWAQAGQSDSADAALHAVHDALFASFLPVNDLPNDPKTAELLVAAREEIWQGARNSAGFRQLLQPFEDLRGFGNTCGIGKAIEGVGRTSFDALDNAHRQRVLSLMQHCEENAPRRLAATARNFYIVKGYGAVQEQLTGVRVTLYAPEEYLKIGRAHV